MKKYTNLHIKVGFLVAVLSWLAYTIYWFFVSFGWVGRLSTPSLVISLDILGTLGLGCRIVAAIIVTMIVLKIFSESSIPVRLIRYTLHMEIFYGLSLVPIAILGIFAPFLTLFGVDGSGIGVILFLGTGIPYLVQAIIIPLTLHKLRSKLTLSSKWNMEAIKWSYVAGFFYILFFWLNYSMQWFIVLSGITTPPTPARGITYIVNYPINMLSFLLTLVGLFALMIFYIWSALPIIKNFSGIPNFKRVGVTLTGLGGYSVLIISLYTVFGFVGGDSIWTSIFFKHNADLWCIALPALGVPLLFHET